MFYVCLFVVYFILMSEASSLSGLHGVAKWGVTALAGFQQVPDALLMKQQALGLDALDVLVLLNITSFWWRGDQPPYLRPKLIAGRLDVTVRSVQRVLKKLEEKKLIRRGRWTDQDGKSRPAVFLDGLLDQLATLTVTDKILSERMRKAPAYGDSTKAPLERAAHI